MKLHLGIQCQREGLSRIPVKSQIQPASLLVLGLPAWCYIDMGLTAMATEI